MDLHLAGRTALVTAGSKGMGRSIALACAREGMHVAIAARGKEALNATLVDMQDIGAKATSVSADVTKPDGIDEIIATTVEAFGEIDVLIVNAGGPPAVQFEQATDADWQSAVELTLMSAVRLIRGALPHLHHAGGSIVAIQSISVKQPVQGLVLSNAVRPGVVGLMKTLADEFGPRGIRVNTILPGMIMTNRARELAEARAHTLNIGLDEVLAETVKAIPLGRYGDPDEVANLALFLASPVSSYLTGTAILCDGGLYRGLL